MKSLTPKLPETVKRLTAVLWCCFAIAIAAATFPLASRGQQPEFDSGAVQPPVDARAQRQPEIPVEVDASEIQQWMNDTPETSSDPAAGELTEDESSPSGIDLLTLITRGGAFMIPIAITSLLVVALAFERFVMLRKNVLMPRRLVQQLRELADPIHRFDPSEALKLCRSDSSQASRVVEAMLMRTGQPLSDIERAASESLEREADKCAAPIRWLTLAAAATPLMGLLGTVWGMIVAFHESTTLTPDRTRSEQLSEGIYTALVTTLAGLIVAIPAAILALYLENRLAKLFHRLEEFAFELAPGLTRFAGHRRIDGEGTLHPVDRAAPPSGAEAVQPPPPARTANAGRGGYRAG